MDTISSILPSTSFSSEEKISIVVKNPHQEDVFFKIKKTIGFQKLFTLYCKQIGQDIQHVKFSIRGQTIRSDQNLLDFNIQNDDVINAMVENEIKSISHPTTNQIQSSSDSTLSSTLKDLSSSFSSSLPISTNISNDSLSIKVKSQDGNELFFKVKKTTPLQKLMDAYCKKLGQDKDTVRFLFDGQRLRAEQTPSELNMENEDEIDAMIQQVGGKGGKE